jgi:hypothetical protein
VVRAGGTGVPPVWSVGKRAGRPFPLGFTAPVTPSTHPPMRGFRDYGSSGRAGPLPRGHLHCVPVGPAASNPRECSRLGRRSDPNPGPKDKVPRRWALGITVWRASLRTSGEKDATVGNTAAAPPDDIVAAAACPPCADPRRRCPARIRARFEFSRLRARIRCSVRPGCGSGTLGHLAKCPSVVPGSYEAIAVGSW